MKLQRILDSPILLWIPPPRRMTRWLVASCILGLSVQTGLYLIFRSFDVLVLGHVPVLGVPGWQVLGLPRVQDVSLRCVIRSVWCGSGVHLLVHLLLDSFLGPILPPPIVIVTVP